MCVAREESSSQGQIRGGREAVMGVLGSERWPWAAPGKAYGSILQSLTLSVILPVSLVSVWVSLCTALTCLSPCLVSLEKRMGERRFPQTGSL